MAIADDMTAARELLQTIRRDIVAEHLAFQEASERMRLMLSSDGYARWARAEYRLLSLRIEPMHREANSIIDALAAVEAHKSVVMTISAD
jgi:hypothetical protein